MRKQMSQLQNSERMSGNPTSRPFLGWNKGHGGSMGRQKGRRPFGRTSGRPQGEGQRPESNSSAKMGRSGKANRRARVLQLAQVAGYFVIPLGLALAVLSGCASNISYSPLPNMRVSVPVSFPYPGKYGKTRLPSGSGGYKKTGKPYTIAGKRYHPLQSAAGFDETGTASWYGRKFHGRKTANGERYDMHALSAAHRVLPLPTMVRVTNLENGRQIVVRVNDRGPFARNRVIDMSYAAARQLGFDKKGTARVRVQALEGASSRTMVAQNRQPRPSVRAIVKPVMTPKPSTPNGKMGGMYVQLGAFLSQANASRLQRSLASEYPDTHIRTYNGASQMLYRVRIGPYSDPQRIEQVVLALKDNGFPNVIVIIE